MALYWPDRHADSGCTSTDAYAGAQPAKTDCTDPEAILRDRR
jgi:hypothetical protein